MIMKQIAILLSFTVLSWTGFSCQSGSEANSGSSDNSGGLFSQRPTNEFTQVDEGPIYTFTVVPEKYENCNAVFAESEEEVASGQYIFATDLRKSCVLAVDGRILEFDLVAKRTTNLTAQFYKYEGHGFMIDLEIRQSEEVGPNLKKVRGQLKVFGNSGFRDIYYIQGEVKC